MAKNDYFEAMQMKIHQKICKNRGNSLTTHVEHNDKCEKMGFTHSSPHAFLNRWKTAVTCSHRKCSRVTVP